MIEERRQKQKEEAVLLALQRDIALVRRGLKVYGMKKDGSQILICQSSGYEYLWENALEALKQGPQA